MTRFVWGYVYWGGIWLGLGFLVAELLGYFGVAPWPTLSSDTWHAESTYPFVAPALFALFIGLSLHFFYHRTLMFSLAVGVALSVVAHLIDHKIP